jgi:hypothetical protein
MELSKVYSMAKTYRSYNEFKSAIDKEINDVPITVASSNEFELVVKNTVDLADVGGNEVELKCDSFAVSKKPNDPYCAKCRKYPWEHD